MCCFNTFTWNHTVAAYVKAAPDLHHDLRHDSEVAPLFGSGVPLTVTTDRTDPLQTVSTWTRATRSLLDVPITVPTNTVGAASTWALSVAAPPGPTGPAHEAQTAVGAVRTVARTAKLAAANARLITVLTR